MGISSQSLELKKRDRSPSLEKLSEEPFKKRRPDFIKVTLSLEADYYSIGSNKVWLSNHTFKKLFYGCDIEQRNFVKVAHYIYEVGINNDLSENKINIDEIQAAHLDNYCSFSDGESSLKIKSYHENEYDHKDLDHITFSIQEYGEIIKNGENTNSQTVDIDNLRKFIYEKINGQFLEQGQSLLLNHPLGILRATVDSQKYIKDPLDGQQKKKNVRHGRIIADTKIDFICESGEFKIVKPYDPKLIKSFQFLITAVKDVSRKELGMNSHIYTNGSAWRKGNSPLPLALPIGLISTTLRKKTKNIDLAFGDSVKVRASKDWQISFKFTKVTLETSDDADEKMNDQYEKKYTKTFKLQSQHCIKLNPKNNCVLTTKISQALVATRVKFVIADMQFDKKIHNQEHYWVSYKELIAALNKDYFPIPKCGTFVVKTTSGKFLLKLDTAIGSKIQSKISQNKNISDLWAIDSGTDIRIRIDDELNLELVDSRVELFLEGMKFKVELPKNESLVSMLLGKKDDHEKVIIEEEKMRELLLDNLPTTIFPNHKIHATTDKGVDIIFTLEKYDCDRKKGIAPKYGVRLKPTADTKIEFNAKKDGDIIISTKPEKIELINLAEKLKEIGIGGLTEECTLFIRDIILSRGEFREYYKSLGINPERGAILYGPPGTGKTKLARNFANLLGVTKDRQTLLTGSRVKNMWVGESENNIRKLFKPARDAQQQFGENSPLFILVIDEIDAILGGRNGQSSKHDTSLVATFLSELDGIAGDDGESLDNIIVIGLTNDLNVIDEAVKRPGRLGTHIKIGIPDLKGRKEIIEIHARNLIKNNLIEGDVSEMIDWLANKTEGKTGAFIEGVVTKAFHISTGRLLEQKVMGREAIRHKAAKITKKDIENGIKALDSGRDEVAVPFGIYT